MPYIAIKAFPKDAKTKQEVVDKINQVFIETWGCPPQAITVSLEEVEPTVWDDTVKAKEIVPNDKHMMILDGKKRY